ncbi:MAG: restriction endonuclease subunit S, partial [Candidatus Thiodiazotropha sp. 'RUGA']|nr:restriction endonuclease subunit S [Candidatus Thiodiazotropha sp. 'RUGA']
ELPLEDCMEAIIDYRGKTPKKTTSGVPLITAKIIKGGSIQPVTEFIAEDDYETWMRRGIPNPGDIVMTTEAPLGEVAQLDDRKVALAQRVITLRGKPGLLDNTFLKYLLSSHRIQHQLEGRATGTTVKGIKQSELRRVVLNFPSFDEQKAIAHILGTLDDKIVLNRQMNTTLEAMAQALFKSWFVDFDPVIDNALATGNPIPESLNARAEARKALGDQRNPLPDAIQEQFPDRFVFNEDMGWVPEGWEVEPLKALTTKIGSGATPRGGSQVYQEEGTTLIRSQNVYDSSFVWEGLAHISEDAANQLKGVTVQTDDVLLNITGASILRTCVVDPQVLPARVNQHVAIIRARESIPPRFLHIHLLQRKTKDLLLGQNAGASREAVTKGHIEAVSTLVPNKDVLQKFNLFTDPLFQKKNKLTGEIRVLASLRETLLPKLLSGQLPIPDAEKQLAEAI